MANSKPRTRAEELTPHGRAAVVTLHLVREGELTNKQIRDLSGLQTLTGVHYLMGNIGGAGIPVYQPRNGVWALLDERSD